MKTLIFDLDGTMYRDTSIIESAKRFLDYCIEKKIPFIFMTNNAMRTQKENAKHMLTMGYEGIEPWMFYNSAMASCQYVKSISDKRKAYYIGRDGMKMALMDEGFLITEDKPDFVFVGLDKECTYASYSKALSFLLDGATLIGTNKDRVLVKQGGFEVGNGSVVALFEYASNQKSPDIAKPAYPILELCMKHFHLKKEDIILVGDNLETDIKLGYNHGIKTIFVQTGVHTEADIERYHIVPTYTVNTLDELIDTQIVCCD